MPIETVFLDAGGVLVFPNWNRVAAALARHGVTTTGAALAAVELAAKHQVDSDTRGEPDLIRGWIVFDRVFARTGVTDQAAIDAALADLQGYHAEFNLWESVPDDVEPSLARMRAAGCKLVVVSNANGRMRAALQRVGIARYFDVIVDSFEEQVEKPDPRIFHLALARSGGDEATTVHVGDLFHTDVVGARAAGLRPILLDRGWLYDGVDCERVSSLTALADLIERELR